MELAKALSAVAREQAIVEGVLNQYVSKHGCPCGWRQFEYWVSKPQGRGWQDNIQNYLVTSARALPCFDRPKDKPPEYGHDLRIACHACGRVWRYTSEEWRMMATHEHLIPVQGSHIAAEEFGTLTSGSIFATAGYIPEGIPKLTIEQWAEFMLGEPYRSDQLHPILATRAASSRSFFRRILDKFGYRS